MKLKLSSNAISLLKHVLSTTGEKEVGPNGQEVNSPRYLNGVESSQRHHFFKNTDSILNGQQEEINKAIKGYNEDLEKMRKEEKEKNPKNDGESDKDYDQRIAGLLNLRKELIEMAKELNDGIKEMRDQKNEFEITEKTYNVVKKYYLEYGDKTGFKTGDGEIIEEINEVLGIEE